MTEQPLPRLRWAMVSLAFLATVINYLDRQALSVAAPMIRDELRLTNLDYSRIVFGFMLAYTIMNGISGPLVDRLGTRAGYALCMAWWSAASMLHTFAIGVWSLGACRFLLGMGEAGNWPAAVKIVSEWFPPRERALASGIFNSGSSVGAILAPPLIAWTVLQFGWRQAFVLVGCSGVIWLLVWCPLYRVPQRERREQGALLVSMRELLSNRFAWSFTFSKVFMDPVWYFYIFWFPEYLNRVRHFDVAQIGKYAWIPFLLAGFGNILGGWSSSFLLRWGVSLSDARKLSVTIFSLLMTSAIPAVLTADVRLSIALVSVAMIGYTGSLANMLTFPADVFPTAAVASVYGMASMGSGFGGMVFALITGWVVEYYSYTPVFIGFGIMPLVCATIIWTLMGPISPESAGKKFQEYYVQ
jgi:MFS transporter, ACS family, aldohexuronate transporter